MSEQKKRTKPVFLPGADPEKDCQTVGEQEAAVSAPDDHDVHEHDVSWRDVSATPTPNTDSIAGWLPQRARWSQALERLALVIEAPANRLIGTTQLNPFYHTGTIAVLLLLVVGLTGFYLFLFYQYGFDASYNAVLTRIETPFIARTVRAIHRYASGALVITTLLHAFRTLFMERFRGPRWLAWVTGIVMTILLWLAGVTGYWLIWDERAQLINDRFVDLLEPVTPWAARYMAYLTRAAANDTSWPLFLSVFAVHVILFLIVAGFFYLHIRRLSRPKWLPPAFLVVGVSSILLLVSLFFPAGMLEQGDLGQVPGRITLDPLFLFYLPAAEQPLLNSLLWGGLLLGTSVLTLLPWLRRRDAPAAAPASMSLEPPLVSIIKDRCTGCTVCAVDCPYGVIEMVERHDGKRHKYIALEDPSLCVSCGICVGACDGVAVTLGQDNPALLWDTVAARLTLARMRAPGAEMTAVFTCERHALHGARPYLDYSAAPAPGTAIEVIPLPCVGAAPPDLLSRTLEQQGVSAVRVIGCPPDDCANREGNLWLEQRLTRERVPRLKKPYANAPLTASWLAPDDFARGLTPRVPMDAETAAEPDYLEQRRMFQPLAPRNYIVAFLLLALVLVVQILLTDLPFTPYQDVAALNRVVVPDLGATIGRSSYLGTTLGPTLTVRLELDGRTAHEQTVPTAAVLGADSYPYYYETPIDPGVRDVRLTLWDPSSGTTFVLFDQQTQVHEDDILTIPPP